VITKYESSRFEPPDWQGESFEPYASPVGVILLIFLGCWGIVILAGWGLWELLS